MVDIPYPAPPFAPRRTLPTAGPAPRFQSAGPLDPSIHPDLPQKQRHGPQAVLRMEIVPVARLWRPRPAVTGLPGVVFACAQAAECLYGPVVIGGNDGAGIRMHAEMTGLHQLVQASKALRDDLLMRAESRLDPASGQKYKVVAAGRTAWANFTSAIAAAEGTAMADAPATDDLIGRAEAMAAKYADRMDEDSIIMSAGMMRALVAALVAPRSRPPKDLAAQFDGADWFWRTMDPDDCGDSPIEAINRSMLGWFCVCEIASSYSGPIRYGFIAPVLDPDSDDDEFLHFATQGEAIEAAKVRADLRDAEEAMADTPHRVQHVKRGSTYRVIGAGKIQTDAPLTDYTDVVIYQSEEDGLIWVRP